MDGARPEEAERWYQIARKLLEIRDLIGCKKFAERAMDADPLLDGVDQIVAAADVLLASQRRINDNLNWYSILQLDPFSSLDDLELPCVKRAYRRLALLLNPQKNDSPSAALAFQLVTDAWNFLSDPTKKGPFDQEIKNTAQLRPQTRQKSQAPSQTRPQTPPQARPQAPSSTFWTICLGCYGAFEYEREHQGKMMACCNCQKPFQAVELPTEPPVVPGTDRYYCSWGLFPLGFPGAPVFDGVVIPEGAICIPPNLPPNTPQQTPSGGGDVRSGRKSVNKKKAKAIELTTTMGDVRSGRKSVNKKKAKAMELTTTMAFNTRLRSAGKATPPVASRASGRKPRKVLAHKPNKQDTSPARQQSQSQAKMLLGGKSSGIDQENKDDGGSISEVHQQNATAGDYGGRFDMNSSFTMDFNQTAEVLGNLENLPFLKDDEVAIMQ